MTNHFSFILTMSIMALIGPSVLALESRIDYGDGRVIGTLPYNPINESSGLARGRNKGHFFWTHNDSGDTNRLFSFKSTGELVAQLTITGATNTDWEDMASFSHNGVSYLLVGAIGDNYARRDHYRIHLIREPVLEPSSRTLILSTEVERTIEFMYEDGPHDCESLAVDPANGVLYLVSKITPEYGDQCAVYSLPLWGNNTGRRTARRLTYLDMPPVTTGMDISSDGRRAIITTYQDAYEFIREEDETWRQAFRQSPRRISMPQRDKGESICYGLDGQTLYLTSEARGDKRVSQPLFMVPVIGTVAYDPANPAPILPRGAN